MTKKVARFGASSNITARLKFDNDPELLGLVATTIGSFDAMIGAIDVVGLEDGCTVRDITFTAHSLETAEQIVAALKEINGVKVINYSDRVFRSHLGGKIKVVSRVPLRDAEDLATAYTPGVARVCTAIHEDPEKAWNLTMKGNTVLVVSDASRLLALGNYGEKVPEAGLPVMEGKAAIFAEFGDVSAIPLVLKTQDPKKIIETVVNLSPNFGGIVLEDIANPGCWEIERHLNELLDVPVFHDDQHGTAIVVLAGVLNAAKLIKRQMRHLKVVACGVGAAGMACIKLLRAAGVRNIIGYNKDGAIYRGRPGMNSEEQWLAQNSNPRRFKGSMKEALKGADLFLGLSVGGILQPEDLAVMRKPGIVFALANPNAEVDPIGARDYVHVVATGGSHYPNQINNALAFPGVFRGALECRARRITEEMKLAAAKALASAVPPAALNRDYIIPSLFHPGIQRKVADAVVKAAHESGVARRARRLR